MDIGETTHLVATPRGSRSSRNITVNSQDSNGSSSDGSVFGRHAGTPIALCPSTGSCSSVWWCDASPSQPSIDVTDQQRMPTTTDEITIQGSEATLHDNGSCNSRPEELSRHHISSAYTLPPSRLRYSRAVPIGTKLRSSLHRQAYPDDSASVLVETRGPRPQRRICNFGAAVVILRDAWRTFFSSTGSSQRLLYLIGFFAIFFMAAMLAIAISFTRYANVGFLKLAQSLNTQADFIVNINSYSGSALEVPDNATSSSAALLDVGGSSDTRSRQQRRLTARASQPPKSVPSFYFFNFTQAAASVQQNRHWINGEAAGFATDCLCTPRLTFPGTLTRPAQGDGTGAVTLQDIPLIFIDIDREDALNIGYNFKSTFRDVMPLGSNKVVIDEMLAEALFPDTPPVLGQSRVTIELKDGQPLLTALRTMAIPPGSSLNVASQNDTERVQGNSILGADFTIVGIMPTNNMGKLLAGERKYAMFDLAALYRGFLYIDTPLTSAAASDVRARQQDPLRVQSHMHVDQLSAQQSPQLTSLATSILFRAPKMEWYTQETYEEASRRVQNWAERIYLTLGISSDFSLMPPPLPQPSSAISRAQFVIQEHQHASVASAASAPVTAQALQPQWPGTSLDLPMIYQLQFTQLYVYFFNFVVLLLIVVMSTVAGWMCSAVLEVLTHNKRPMLAGWRMLGGGRGSATTLVLVQVLLLAAPATILGLVAAQLVYLRIREMVTVPGYDMPTLLTPEAIIISASLGLLVPMLASIHPIRALLFAGSTSLKASEHEHAHRPPVTLQLAAGSKAPGTHGAAARSSLLSASLEPHIVWRAAAGFIMAAYCWVVYYLLPRALVTANFSLMFTILLFELLFSICLAFMVAFAMIVNTEFQSQQLDLQRTTPAEIKVTTGALTGSGDPIGLPIDDIERSLAQLRQSGLDIQYGYHTWSLASFYRNYTTHTAITNTGKILTTAHDVYGVTPGFLDVLQGVPLLQVNSPSAAKQQPHGLSNALLNAGPRAAITASVFSQPQSMSLQVNDQYLIQTQFNRPTTGNNTVYFPLRCAATLNSAPLFSMSEYGQTAPKASWVSLDTMAAMLRDVAGPAAPAIPASQLVAIQGLYINVHPVSQTDTVVAAIKAVLTARKQGADFARLSQQEKDIAQAQTTMSAVSSIMVALPVFLGGVSLALGMSVNVASMRREIAIVRVCGLTAWDMIWLLVCEGVVVMVTSTLIGTAVGVILGWLVGKQRSMFVGTDIPFQFPTSLFLTILGVNVAVAVVASLLPAVSAIKARSFSLR
ncbi:hypothetical protein RI367_003144 [Sorochytrium milnesiophthora]